MNPTGPITPTEVVEQGENFVSGLRETQSIIGRLAKQLLEIKTQKKLVSERFNSLFENDSELAEIENKAQPFILEAKQHRQKIKEAAEAIQLQLKKKELSEEEGEIKQSLNGHLLRYYQMTGSSIMETAGGTEVKLSFRAGFGPKQLELFGGEQ